MLMALLLSATGCGRSDVVSVSGVVLLDGRPATGELLFEPLTEKGKRTGQSATVHSDSSGRFIVAVPTDGASHTHLPCRIVITLPRGAKGMSSAFDYDALPDKVVELQRTISDDTSLSLLLTQ
jgi:hypothetical protein